jgi:hypothetical protein
MIKEHIFLYNIYLPASPSRFRLDMTGYQAQHQKQIMSKGSCIANANRVK